MLLIAQLYCYRCGEELDAESSLYKCLCGEVEHTFVECPRCEFELTGEDARAEMKAAWQELQRCNFCVDGPVKEKLPQDVRDALVKL